MYPCRFHAVERTLQDYYGSTASPVEREVMRKKSGSHNGPFRALADCGDSRKYLNNVPPATPPHPNTDNTGLFIRK